jgi:transposase
MSKYDEVFKRKVVRSYLSGAAGFNSTGRRYGLDQSTVRRWVEAYRAHGIKGLRKKHATYDAEFKLSVLRRMQADELSGRQVVALFDLRGGVGVVTKWQRQYDQGGLEALMPRLRGRPKRIPMTKPPETPLPLVEDKRTLEALHKENEYLRAEVAYLKKLDALVRAKHEAAQKKRKL